MKKKRAMTLLEIMIVILIIGIIGSVVGYNMRGSLTEGKAFKSREGIRQLYEIFQLELVQGRSLVEIEKDAEQVLKSTGLVRNPKKLLLDGWEAEYRIIQSPSGDDIRIYSDNYIEYWKKKKNDKDAKLEYPWGEE